MEILIRLLLLLTEQSDQEIQVFLNSIWILLYIIIIICFLQLLNNHSMLKLMILIKTLTLKHLTGCQQRFRYRHLVVSSHNLFFYFSKNLVSYVVIVSKPNKMAKRMSYISPAAMLLMLKFMWYDCAQLHISSCHVTHIKVYVIWLCTVTYPQLPCYSC